MTTFNNCSSQEEDRYVYKPRDTKLNLINKD